jgi:hypothetical protein
MSTTAKGRRLKFSTNLDAEVAAGVETVAEAQRMPVSMLLRNVVAEWWERRHAPPPPSHNPEVRA